MLKFNSWRHKTLIYYLNKTLQSPNPNPLFHHYPSLFSLHFCTNTSDSTPFPVSYLINTFGFSPQSASKLCSTYRLRFKTAKKPDSVLAFFRNHGFSDSQLRYMIVKVPWLLTCNPSKRVLPKFQFFLSKGASHSDIVNLVSKNPRILSASLKNSDDSTTFAVSYLINNFGFCPKSAPKLCSTYSVRFKTAQKPDSVLNFFRNHGFSDTQLRHIIAKLPWLLSCNPSKRVLPKFQFLLSKGVSNSDIVSLVTKTPMVLSPSLENHIVPTYELLYRFLQSDKDVIACAIGNPSLLTHHFVPHNIRVLIENGVTDSNISKLLRIQSNALLKNDILNVVEELKDLGFNPSQSVFYVALIAKIMVTKTRWEEKVDAFSKWGWSDEDVLEAFKKQPHCMLTSIDKINSVMSFWVNQLGWDARAIVKLPRVFGSSLERRIIPRAAVMQYLLKKGLLKKKASLTTPFIVVDKVFLERYINRYKEESSYLLKLYEEKVDLAHAGDKTDTMS